MHEIGFIEKVRIKIAVKRFNLWVKLNHQNDYIVWFEEFNDKFWSIYGRLLKTLELIKPSKTYKEMDDRFCNQNLMKLLYYYVKDVRKRGREQDLIELIARALYILDH